MTSKILEFKKPASNYSEQECTCKKEYAEDLDYKKVLKEEEEYWRCNCGSILFFLTKLGAKCRNCGLISNDWVN
jgi:hypothetical protein